MAACSGSHPLAGAWGQDLPDGKKGMVLEFQIPGSECMVHTAPGPDGGHSHIRGTYTFDEASGALTVEVDLLGEGKANSFGGKLDGDRLQIGAADQKLVFKRVDSAH